MGGSGAVLSYNSNGNIVLKGEHLSEYHISLHPKSKLDGIGEASGGAWVEWQNRGTNFTVSCLDLHLDQLPSKEDQEIMLSYCTYIPHLRALFEPTALYFGIPGNVVAIAAFMSMNPLRPASILLALVAIGDLITLIAGILPMEGNYHLSSARSVHYYWMHSFYAVASAFPALRAGHPERGARLCGLAPGLRGAPGDRVRRQDGRHQHGHLQRAGHTDDGGGRVQQLHGYP